MGYSVIRSEVVESRRIELRRRLVSYVSASRAKSGRELDRIERFRGGLGAGGSFTDPARSEAPVVLERLERADRGVMNVRDPAHRREDKQYFLNPTVPLSRRQII